MEFGLVNEEGVRGLLDNGAGGNHEEIALEYGAGLAARRWLLANQTLPWQPPADMFALPDRLVVMIEIAGMRDADFRVTLQSRRLVVSGVRERADFARNADYHQAEVHYGEFHTEFVLPWTAQPETVNAIYRDGFLRIELPRAPNRAVHIVDVGQEPDQDADVET